jgi:S-adenosyl-L-methionine hydrolase (adenosine-forming)
LFSGVLSRESAIASVELTNSKYWRTPEPSTTFHGRDIFATVGAHLANGVALLELGESIDPTSLVRLQLPNCTIIAAGIEGSIQYVDRFGNLITNIPNTSIQSNNWSVRVSNISNSIIIPRGETYNDAQPGDLIAIIGSHGWLEISVNGGSAQSVLKLECGAIVQLLFGTNN